jgi:Ca2+/H+ antiporter
MKTLMLAVSLGILLGTGVFYAALSGSRSEVMVLNSALTQGNMLRSVARESTYTYSFIGIALVSGLLAGYGAFLFTKRRV